MVKLQNSVVKAHQAILQFLSRRPDEGQILAFLREFVAFGYKQAISCIFPVFIFGMLAISRYMQMPGVYRYDLLLISCLGMQVLMYKLKLETRDEVYVICLFHFLGVAMEVFKVNHGAWAYPEPAYSKVFGVPLYSGFMYASVASFMCQAWRNLDLRYSHWPSLRTSSSFAVVIYGNFYSNAYIVDLRLLIIPALLYAFRNTWVHFNCNGVFRRMPLALAFALIAFFVWLAENIGTFLGAWRYPHQSAGWSMVRLQLMSSWFLLVIVSLILVAILKQVKANRSHVH